VGQLAIRIPVVPSTLDGDALMDQIRANGLQTALVADEYGGIAGMVTVEDLIEEIVGEIRDEHDRFTPEVVRITGGHRVSGLLRIDEVAEQTGYRAHEGDYETIGGVIMDALGHIPAEGESVDLTAFEPEVLDDPPVWRATVAKMDGRRIDLLDLVRVTPPTKDGGRN
jgi:CBS domain containing-hemolysin-like protein